MLFIFIKNADKTCILKIITFSVSYVKDHPSKTENTDSNSNIILWIFNYFSRFAAMSYVSEINKFRAQLTWGRRWGPAEEMGNILKNIF